MTLSTPQLPPYLSSLNPEQLEAVLHEGSPLLILAGAGTGKTRVITTKIAYLVKERGISPESILAVTFTNKAAREMRERATAIEISCERSVIRTFHSFGAWFLRRNASAIGLDSNFVIYDDGDSSELVRAILPEASKQECNRYASMIARAKDFGLEPDAPNLSVLFHDEEFRRIYHDYTERLRRTGNVDFGDLIGLPQAILEKDDAIALRMRQRFSVVLVDEYQDSNVAQFSLLQKLTSPATYVCVVGDDDQSIYRFRGAEVKNILSFPQRFPGTKIIRLERNYRSSQSILDVAGNIVSHNSGRLGKTLRATKPGGYKPQLALLDDQEQEVEFCTRLLRQHIHDGGRLSDVAILYRTNAQSLSFEKEFPRKLIPYRLVGALRFYEREEVKDILAYLSLIQNPRDEIAFKRAVNKPTRGLGDSSVEIILETAARLGLNIVDACEESRPAMKGKAGAGLDAFLSILGKARAQLRAGSGFSSGTGGPEGPYSLSDGGEALRDRGSKSLGALLELIIAESGLASYHKSQDEFAGTQKLANMEELVSAASLYPLAQEGLAEFLETIELDRSFQAKDASGEKDAVNLITMHNTKGLEFPVVIVTGLEQGLFPRDDEEGEDIEEQRRLFYVSVTRAKDRLYLTACRWRRMRGRIFETSPSLFLTKIDPSLYEFWGDSSSSSAFARRAAFGKKAETARESRPIPRSGDFAVRPQPPTQIRPQSSVWKQGQAVYHDEYGQGVIIKSSETENSGSLVIVQFDSGKVAQFFPKYTRKLERIKE
ncbi:MAG: UvrD-helicase domain-containing protein [Spirochaetes bacterium]|nr:UvrD-helicase domain-containing protein [Spirochaetota bacterium]